ncbi:MAG TPA: glycine zipper 2TM domain-containing protein [Verrucomicrobia bacterium]|jgi:hypothetical protein|nr:glycine zipper 2TM domain-containing protein [Verrucomicrobiota bacterium]
MKKTAVFALILLTISVCTTQAQLFPGLNIPGLRAAGDPAPAPQPAPQTRAPATATTTVLGAAIGGVLGSKSNRTAEGTAIGGALGLLIGQMMDRKAAQKTEADRQAALERAQIPNAETGATGANGPLPQIDPATGLPIDPNAPAPGTAAPAIDPATGLPVLANGTVPAPAVEAPAKPQLSPRQRVKKLFGR